MATAIASIGMIDATKVSFDSDDCGCWIFCVAPALLPLSFAVYRFRKGPLDGASLYASKMCQGESFSPAAIGVLITVSLVGDMAGTYVIGLVADSWGRRRTLALLSLLMAATGVVFGLATNYPVLLVAAFFGTLGTSASETAPFLPIDQAMLAQVTEPSRRTALFARYNLVASGSSAGGALVAGLPGLLTQTGLPQASGIGVVLRKLSPGV